MTILDFRRLAVAASFSLVAATAVSAQESTAAPATQPAAPTAAPAAAPAPAEAPRRTRRDRNKITAEELAERTEADLFSYLQGARPQWLRARGKGSINLNEQVWVYRDGVRIGGVAALRGIRPSEVREVQHMDGTQATQRYGLEHGAGAIFVVSR